MASGLWFSDTAPSDILPFLLSSSAEVSVKGVAATNPSAASLYSLFSSTYKNMVAHFDDRSNKWYSKFGKLSSTSAVATMTAFDEGFIQHLRDADIYHYTSGLTLGLAQCRPRPNRPAKSGLLAHLGRQTCRTGPI